LSGKGVEEAEGHRSLVELPAHQCW
jgi:hypothetical protein